MNDPDRRTGESIGSHYFSTPTGLSSKRGMVRLSLPELTVDLVTDRGVFSPTRIDPGTKLLLMELPDSVLSKGPLLDLGCGYGPIAVTLARRSDGEAVYAVDVNERALELCRENLMRLSPDDKNFWVGRPEDVPDEVTFGAIVSNPPIRVGKTVLHAMLRAWLPRLGVDGEAWLVVHRHLGADSLSTWLREQGYRSERVRSRQGYRILRIRAAGED